MLILIVVIHDHDGQLMIYDENNTFNFRCNDDKHNIVAMMATINTDNIVAMMVMTILRE